MAANLLRQPTTQARARLVLLHGWGADAGDLMPLGEALSEAIATPLELVALQAPQLQSKDQDDSGMACSPPTGPLFQQLLKN